MPLYFGSLEYGLCLKLSMKFSYVSVFRLVGVRTVFEALPEVLLCLCISMSLYFGSWEYGHCLKLSVKCSYVSVFRLVGVRTLFEALHEVLLCLCILARGSTDTV